jgi:hypothetical protein
MVQKKENVDQYAYKHGFKNPLQNINVINLMAYEKKGFLCTNGMLGDMEKSQVIHNPPAELRKVRVQSQHSK